MGLHRDPHAQATAMDEPGDVLSLIQESRQLINSGQYAAALQVVEKAINLARLANEGELEAQALVCCGSAIHHLGHYEEMRSLAEQALQKAGSKSQARLEALLLLAAYDLEQGLTNELESNALKACDLARQLGSDEALYQALHHLSSVYGLRGQFALQITTDEEAYQFANRLGSPQQALSLISLYFTYTKTGKYEKAQAMENEMVERCRGHEYFQAYAEVMRAILRIDLGEMDEVLPLLSSAYAKGEKIGDPALQVLTRYGMSRYYRASQQATTALEWANDALRWARLRQNWRWYGRMLVERAQVAWLKADFALAASDLVEAGERLAANQQYYDWIYARLLLALLRLEQGYPSAEELCRQAARDVLRSGYEHLFNLQRPRIYRLITAWREASDPEVVELHAQCRAALQRQPPLPLKVRTLGDFVVRQGGRLIDPQAWRQRRAGELFRLLLVSPKYTLSREQILEALWPEKSPTISLGLFHHATSTLRRILEPELPEFFSSRYLTVEEGWVTLHLPKGSWLDFEQFEALIKNEAWEEAIALYQGVFCPYDLYADWATGPRERIRFKAIQAFLAYARQQLIANAPRRALNACQQVLEMDNWNEEAVYLSMLSCLATNNRARAIHLYRTLEQTLQRELGITPQPKLRQLYQSLLQH